MTPFVSSVTVTAVAANPALDTTSLFDAAYREPRGSPIDEFARRLNVINQSAPHPTNFDPLFGQLVLLGAVAAVESYFRALFRKLIILDETCQSSVHKREVTFGAAIHLPPELLPEALLERISFTKAVAITEAMKDLLGIKGKLPADVDAALEDYARVCHLRHCAVHRFGKLGSGNAIALGLRSHSELLEKPLKLDYASLQSAIAISTGVVRTSNNFIFNAVISRLPASAWSGNYQIDRPLFLKYFDLFADRVTSRRTPAPKSIYDEFQRERATEMARR